MDSNEETLVEPERGWTPTLCQVPGDGTRTHWDKRKTRMRRGCRDLVLSIKQGWMLSAPRTVGWIDEWTL